MKTRLWFAISLLLIVSLACSLGGSDTPADNGETGIEDTGSGESTSGGGETSPTEESTDLQLDESGLAELDSYRMRTIVETTLPDGSVQSLTMEQEVTRDPAAQRVLLQSDEGTVETVQIGDSSWMCFDGECIASQGQEDSLEEDWFDPSDFDTGEHDYLGRETVNGVNTRHFRVDPDTIASSASEIIGVTDAEGEVWIADEAGLPSFVVRMTTSWQQTVEDETTGYSMVLDVYDINESFTIEAPEGAVAAGLPEGIPEYPNATDQFAMAGLVTFTTTDDVATVAEFYRDELPAEGWTLVSDDDLGEMNMQSWTKDETTLSLIITAGDDGTSAMISLE